MRRKKLARCINFILVSALAAAAVCCSPSDILKARAATVSDVQKEIDRLQKELEAEYGKISDLEAEQDLVLEKMEDADAELINTMASIGLKEEEISEKEGEIAAKEDEILEKQTQIRQTAAEYEAAKSQEDAQREDMAVRTRMMYEQGTDTYMDAFLEGMGLADVLNRMDYIEKIYAYSKFKLEEYIALKDRIQALWDQLEIEEAELKAHKDQLEADQTLLKQQKADMEEQKKKLNGMLDRLKKESANYEVQIKRARQEAAAAQRLLKQNQDKLTQMQTAQAVASGTYTSNYAAIINNSSGSELGKKIANYACQYIGNPYKAGGSSLTGGADCSGFTYRVYGNFGYSLPRTSYEQRSAGTGVSYDNAQPGDLICYDGHVAVYIGGGLIVHASNSNPYPRGGIKISNAQYRTILAVRRIL